jgi:hypothetical protein
MAFLRRIAKVIGKALSFLIGLALIFGAFSVVNWISERTLWPFVLFVVRSLGTDSAHLTWLAKGSILLAMLFAAMLIDILKTDLPRVYGWGELAIGAVLAWQTMSLQLSANWQQNIVLLLASVVILEKGITKFRKARNKRDLKKNDKLQKLSRTNRQLLSGWAYPADKS